MVVHDETLINIIELICLILTLLIRRFIKADHCFHVIIYCSMVSSNLTIEVIQSHGINNFTRYCNKLSTNMVYVRTMQLDFYRVLTTKHYCMHVLYMENIFCLFIGKAGTIYSKHR